MGMGGASRASTSGAEAMLLNPANMGFTRQFEIQPAYQVNIESNTHGAGLMAMDSLLNERVALGLGYIATIGGPKVGFDDGLGGERQTVQISHIGHEVGLPLAINAVLGWLAFGVRPKLQQSSMRFLDADNERRDARKTQLKFGLDLALSFSARQYVTIAVVGQNIAGPTVPATELNLAPYVYAPMSLDRARVSPVSDYPRMLSHALAVFPTKKPGFSINFDGTYDFTSYRHDNKYTRMLFAGGVEYSVRDIVPLRLGGYWDSRGRGSGDDRGYIALGGGFFRPATKGGVGFNIGLGFSRQITGPSPETLLSFSLGLLINPSR